MTLLDRVVNERYSEQGLKVLCFFSKYKYLILGQINIFMWAEVQMYMHTYTSLYVFVYLYRETEKIIIFFLDILYIWRELTVMHLIIEIGKVYWHIRKLEQHAVIGSRESQKKASGYQVDNQVLCPNSQIQYESLFKRNCSFSIYHLVSQPMASDNFSCRSLSIWLPLCSTHLGESKNIQ